MFNGRSTGNSILNNMTNIMPDRHVVNKKTNAAIQQFKENKDECNNIYCAVHPLDMFTYCSVQIVKNMRMTIVLQKTVKSSPVVVAHTPTDLSMPQAKCFTKKALACRQKSMQGNY